MLLKHNFFFIFYFFNQKENGGPVLGTFLYIYIYIYIYFFSLRLEGCVVYDHSSTMVIGVVTKHTPCFIGIH